MASSLRSIFEFSDKRALLVAADRATLYLWQNGTLASSFIFPHDDGGMANFKRYLTQSASLPTYIMVDVVEEEYRHDTVPHVRGKDRRAVIERRQQRLFRGTEFCHAVIQGREEEGRRDDEVLLTALTKPELITPWIDALMETRNPIPGIYSLPLISYRVLKKLGGAGKNSLLVSLQSSNGLRQSFFRDDQLKVSRLAPMPRLGTVPFASHLMAELEKLRRYLNSLALVSGDAPLDIYLLSHGEYLDELENRCRNSEYERFFLVDVADAAKTLGIPGALTTPYSDALFGFALLDAPPANHYARKPDRHFHRLHQARTVMTSAGVCALLLSAVMSSVNFIEGIAFKQKAIDAQNQANYYRTRFEDARRGLPPTAVPPREVEAAVAMADTLAHFRASPEKMMFAISDAVSQLSAVEIDVIDWRASGDPNTPVGPNLEESPDPDAGEIAEGFSFYHVGHVGGRLTDFNGDFRMAINQVTRLAEDLRARPDVAQVQITRMPIEISSSRSLSATTDPSKVDKDAQFALRIVMGIRGEVDG